MHPPISAVRDAVARALAEDLTPLGDITSGLLPRDATATATFSARVDGVLAGRLCADETFAQLQSTVTLEWSADDGDALVAGKAFGTVTGPLHEILTAERTALNFLTHLSGIATADAAVRGRGRRPTRVWDTRKTTPGLRALEKAAVRAGGGSNHRGNLSDWVLLKDNHLAVLGITEAVARARAQWPARTIHVECERIEQVEEALAAGADAVLLDNMTPDEVRAGVARSSPTAGRRCLVEVSGGITLENVARVRGLRCRLHLVGARSPRRRPILDIGLDVVG